MPFAAFDLHKKVIEAVVLDDAGEIVRRERFPATREAIESFASRWLSPQHVIALEATTNTWPVARLLQPLVQRVVISNPLKTKAIASAKVKTDKVDALVLAQLLRAGFLPEVWQPDQHTHLMRARTTERAILTSDRTRIKNRIHAVLHQRLIPAPQGDLFSQANLDWLAALPLDDFGREALNRQLRLLASIETELADVTNELAKHAYADSRVKLLMTLPGVDFAVAETLVATLGDFSRFPDANRAAAYLGLVPSTRQSGDHCYHGPITKQGKSHARWMMIQAAQHLDTHPGPLGVFFRKLAKKKNRNVAVVATARKLVTIAWHMLMNNQPYRYAKPSTTVAKLSRLRIRATGKRKKGGNPKGSPRPAAYGSGQRSKGVPALDAIYASEDLPPIAPLAGGEVKMLQKTGLTDYAADVRISKRVPKGSGDKPKQPAFG